MSPQRRALLSEVMKTAWRFFRSAAARGEGYSAFGDSLRTAWRFVRSLREFAAVLRSARLTYLTPSVIRSPLANVLGEGSMPDFQAAYVTARLGT